jgi:quinol monooxygenase YgiN
MIRHRVDNFEAWKQAFDNFADFRKSSGELSFQVMRKESEQDNVYCLFEWDTIENAREFMKSPDLKKAMQEAGVLEAPEVNFLSEIAKGSL